MKRMRHTRSNTVTQILLSGVLGFVLLLCTACSLSYAPVYSHKSDEWSSNINNFWEILRDEPQLSDHSEQSEVQKQVHFLLQHHVETQRLIRHALPYIGYIQQQVLEKHLPAELILLPFIESEYNPFAYSAQGALGLWQMMPGTASGLEVHINWWYDGRRDLYESTQAALLYLTYLYKFFGNDWLLTIAAYNSGAGTVQQAMFKYHTRNFWELSPYLPEQTRNYVFKFLAWVSLVRHAYSYHFTWPTPSYRSTLISVNIPQQINLKDAAQWAHMNLKTLHQLNPGYRRWATPPHQTAKLLLPSHHVAGFKQHLLHFVMSHRKPIIWQRHTVQQGDNLWIIAHRYQTTLQALLTANHLHKNLIHPGEKILIPVSAHHPIYPTPYNSIISADRLPGPQQTVLAIKKGDTLFKIAQHYRVTPKALRYWNQLKYHPKLKIHNHLIIWADHKKSNPSTSHSKAMRNYHVIHGDTLSTIARHCAIHIHQLQRINHLYNDHIKVGQVLKIPAEGCFNPRKSSYTIQQGDSLLKIAKRFHITPNHIRHINHLKSDLIRIGQVLHLPMDTSR